MQYRKDGSETVSNYNTVPLPHEIVPVEGEPLYSPEQLL